MIFISAVVNVDDHSLFRDCFAFRMGVNVIFDVHLIIFTVDRFSMLRWNFLRCSDFSLRFFINVLHCRLVFIDDECRYEFRIFIQCDFCCRFFWCPACQMITQIRFNCCDLIFSQISDSVHCIFMVGIVFRQYKWSLISNNFTVYCVIRNCDLIFICDSISFFRIFLTDIICIIVERNCQIFSWHSSRNVSFFICLQCRFINTVNFDIRQNEITICIFWASWRFSNSRQVITFLVSLRRCQFFNNIVISISIDMGNFVVIGIDCVVDFDGAAAFDLCRDRCRLTVIEVIACVLICDIDVCDIDWHHIGTRPY